MNRVLPSLDAIISSLLQQVAYGKAHLRIAKGLLGPLKMDRAAFASMR